MVSKRWQRTNYIISHTGLALGAALPLYSLEMAYPAWLRLAIIGVGYLFLYLLIRWLHRKYATMFIKVVLCDHEVAARIIQHTLNAERLPFAKQTEFEQVIFQLRSGNMQLDVDAFLLNMPMNDRLKPEVATKLTLKPETPGNAAQMADLRAAIDAAFAFQGL